MRKRFIWESCKLKEIMDSEGRKITWLAEATNLDRNTVRNIMNGGDTYLSFAYDIAKALNRSVEDIWPQK